MTTIKEETKEYFLFRDIDTDVIVYLENKKTKAHMLNLLNDKGQVLYHEQFKYTDFKNEGHSKEVVEKYKKEPFWGVYTWEGDDLIRYENSDKFIQTDRTKLFNNGLVLK
jgi:hypothetical protein